MDIINPASGQVLRKVDEDSNESVRAKYESARTAQRAWARTGYDERLAVVERFGQLIAAQTETLASTLTSEVGKPIVQAKNELKAVQERIAYFVEAAPQVLETSLVLDQDDLSEEISREPLGVIANISAWNYPYFVGGNVFVPALLTGNAVLYKPSELATLTGLEIARLWQEAGLPDGLFQVVVGAGAAGAALLDQPVHGVFFTGSHATGQSIAARVAERLIPVGMELGGKDPAYVAQDAPIERAAPGLADGAFYNTGQSCCSVERIYVHERIYDTFVERFVEEVRGFKVGDPRREDTYIGPLARREAQLEHLEAQVADARARQATVLLGGHRLDGPGYYFAPTVVADVDHEAAVMREESFGPIIGLMRVGSDEEAVRLMNDTRYGLTAAVYTPDRSRARAILRDLEVGSAYWNCCDRVSPRLPWSGRRDSGHGYTLSSYGIEAFVAKKAWHLRSG